MCNSTSLLWLHSIFVFIVTTRNRCKRFVIACSFVFYCGSILAGCFSIYTPLLGILPPLSITLIMMHLNMYLCDTIKWCHLHSAANILMNETEWADLISAGDTWNFHSPGRDLHTYFAKWILLMKCKLNLSICRSDCLSPCTVLIIKTRKT